MATGFHASNSKGNIQLSSGLEVSCFPCCSTWAAFNFLYLKMVNEITCDRSKRYSERSQKNKADFFTCKVPGHVLVKLDIINEIKLKLIKDNIFRQHSEFREINLLTSSLSLNNNMHKLVVHENDTIRRKQKHSLDRNLFHTLGSWQLVHSLFTFENDLKHQHSFFVKNDLSSLIVVCIPFIISYYSKHNLQSHHKRLNFLKPKGNFSKYHNSKFLCKTSSSGKLPSQQGWRYHLFLKKGDSGNMLINPGKKIITRKHTEGQLWIQWHNLQVYR